MAFADSVKTINAIFLCMTSSFGWPLYQVYLLKSKCSQMKLARMAANL